MIAMAWFRAALAPAICLAFSFPGAASAKGQPAAAKTLDATLAACHEAGDPNATPALRESLWRGRYDLEPLCLYMASTAWSTYQTGRAAELFAIAEVRARYDEARCDRAPNAALSLAQSALRSQAQTSLGEADATPQKRLVNRLAADPRTYRYRSDHLAPVCDGQVKSVSRWTMARAVTRASFIPVG